MKTVRFYCFWVIGFLLVVSCTGKPAQRETTAFEQPSQEQIPDQSEGWKIIEALSKAYGDDPSSIGDFIGSPRCPDFWKDGILTEIHWSFRYGVIRCGHGRYWKRCREARLSVLK